MSPVPAVYLMLFFNGDNPVTPSKPGEPMRLSGQKRSCLGARDTTAPRYREREFHFEGSFMDVLSTLRMLNEIGIFFYTLSAQCFVSWPKATSRNMCYHICDS